MNNLNIILSYFFTMIVDARERELIMALEFEESEIKDFSVEQLEIGDVSISERTVVEIKRCKLDNSNSVSYSDFLASLYDDRLFKQFRNCKDSYENVVYILENYSALDRLDDSQRKQLNSALAKLSCMGASIIPTKDMDETIRTLIKLSQYDQSIGYFIATNKHAKSIFLFDAQVYFLSGLLNVGLETSKSLLEEFETPINIINAIESSKFELVKTKYKLISDLTKIKGFGNKFVEKNQILINTPSKISKSLRMDDIKLNY
jgi:ERCC4-type nuclease